MKTDLRIIKTYKAIHRAFEALIQTKPIAKITVTELARLAEINKSTFYLHYADIRDLYDNALNRHLEKVAKRFTFLEKFIEAPEVFARALIQQSARYALFSRDVYLSADNAPYNQNAIKIFSEIMTNSIISSCHLRDCTENRGRLRFIVSGIGTLLRYYGELNPSIIEDILVKGIRSQFSELMKP